MNTISSTFDENLCDYTILGSEKCIEDSKYPISVLILNRNSGNFKEQNLELLLKNGFESIISLENPTDNYKIDGYAKKFPQVRFILPKKNVSTGELINLGISVCKSHYLLVIWDDYVIKNPIITDAIMSKIVESGSICYVPIFTNASFQQVSVRMEPHIEHFNFSVIPRTFAYDNSKTLYPFDFAGVYEKERFMSVGGFDCSITSDYWQLLDFSIRSWLWGEKIMGSTLFRFSYQNNEPISDMTIDNSYFRFFLKNIAIKIKVDYAYLPVRTFITFHRNSNYSFEPALKEFRYIRKWVSKNKFRYKTEIKKLTDEWESK